MTSISASAVGLIGWRALAGSVATIDEERGSGASTPGRRGHRRAGCQRGLLLPIPGDPHTDREPRVDRARGGATDHREEQDAVARRGGEALPGDRPAVQRGPGAAGAGVQLWRAARQVAGAGGCGRRDERDPDAPASCDGMAFGGALADEATADGVRGGTAVLASGG